MIFIDVPCINPKNRPVTANIIAMYQIEPIEKMVNDIIVMEIKLIKTEIFRL
jgi:hypothetical protein